MMESMATITSTSPAYDAQADSSSPSNPLGIGPALVSISLLAIVFGVFGEYLRWPGSILLLIHLVSYIAGGYIGAKSAIESLREGKIDVDLLMVLAALGAAAIGEWQEGAVLLFLFALSNVLQDYAIGRSRRAIRGLFALYPKEAAVKRGNVTVKVEIKDIKIGDIVLIEPGERIPIDGTVIAGFSAIDESPITGESIPVDKSVGDTVFAGTLNEQGILDVRAQRSAQETTLALIIRLVEEAQDSKAKTERFLDKFEQTYAKVIILGIMLFIIVPPALGLSDFESNFYRAMVLMTVASPCALVISVPSSFISAIAAAARNGILFKGGASIEHLAAVNVIAFDKTGTLTIGRPKVTDIVLASPYSEEQLLGAAGSVESRSEHPLAKAIVHFASDSAVDLRDPTDFVALPGQGVRARLDGKEVQIGRGGQFQNTTPMPQALAEAQARLEQDGKTVVSVQYDGDWMGLIALADKLRARSAELVTQLRKQGINTVMLTGDNALVADSIGRQLGIENVYAGLLPQDKAGVLRELQQSYGTVAMVGDGINDAPALALADVGIAMGGAGTDVALESSDVVLMGDRIERLADAINLARRARRVVWQNIVFSLSVIALLILGVFAADLPLPIGVLGHEGSTVIVVLNGLVTLLLLPELRRRRKRQLAH